MLLGIALLLFGIVMSIRGLGTIETFIESFIIWGAIILGMVAIIYGYFREL